MISFLLLFGLIGSAHLTLFEDSDSDSSEYGVVALDRGNNCTCGWANKDDERIVGGEETKKNEYPMMAGLVSMEKDIVVCGGTILTTRHILTAAHCTHKYDLTDYGIFIGHHNYHKVKDTTNLLEPEKFIIHPNYDDFTLKYDVSIILTKTPMEFSQTVGPACLPTGEIPLVGERVKVLGWGYTKYKGSVSEVLLKVNIDVQPFEKCIDRNMYLELDDKHQLCTFRKNKDSCSGDSGGPLLWLDMDTNRYTLVGATSYGTNCAKYPAVNSDIVYFLPWIQSVISETVPEARTCAKN